MAKPLPLLIAKSWGTQEVIALLVFGVFAVTVLGEPLTWHHAGAFVRLIGAAALPFAGK